MAPVNLTAGAISKLSSGKCHDLKPVLQVMGIWNAMIGRENREIYRVDLSDGSFYKQAVLLCTPLNELVTSQQLQKGSIVQLTKFVCDTLALAVVFKLNVIMEKCDIIGDPKYFLAKPNADKTLPVIRYKRPMQSSQNQPAAPTVTLPNANEGSPVQTHNSEHNAGLHSYVNETSAVPATRPNTRLEGGNEDRPITHQEYKELISEIRKSNNKLNTIFTFFKKALGFTIVLSVFVASILSSQIFSSFRA